MQTPAGSPHQPARSLRWLPIRLARRHRERLVAATLCFVAAALVAAPVAVERGIEGVHFRDQVGTLPVEVGLCHDGRSTLDTGVLGKVFWDQTGALGFGAYARATGPPEAGGSLASYVDPAFYQANVAFIRDPDTVVAAYSSEMRKSLWSEIVRQELVAALLGGAILFMIVPRRRLRGVPRWHAGVAAFLLIDLAVGLSAVAAARMFHEWDCSKATGDVYTATGITNPTFSSSQTSEVVSQVRPFIDKNLRRIDEAADRYESTATTSLAVAVGQRAPTLAPRNGETLVLAEADTQGSLVGVDVRKILYADLADALGPDAISLRTIAGDVTSNGTVAESGYVKKEADVAPDVPVAAVGGDHDSEKTWGQMDKAGFALPDLATLDVNGLKVSGAHDREHKTLFGGSVTNTSGISEEELGAKIRDKVGDGTGIVLMHQPDALAGYLGPDVLTSLRERVETDATRTVPHDDGIPDLPPGIVDIGHLHQADGPWVVWNTDGDTVTWTVVDQLGTAGGVENAPTFSRFSTPFSPPLKPIMVRLQYVDVESGLQTGYATVECDLDAACTISERTDVGLPGGQPGTVASAPAS
jgi:hypothetical protein